MSPVAINGVDKQSISINGVQTKRTLIDSSDTVNQGVYDATTLHAIDADLAVGNIKNGVTIFGFLGTAGGGTLSQDIVGTAQSGLTSANSAVTFWHYTQSVNAGASVTLSTLTQAYDAHSMAVGIGICLGYDSPDSCYLRLFMGGVQVATSPTLNTTYDTRVIGTRALSGSQACYVDIYNGGGSASTIRLPGGVWGSGQPSGGNICVGSIKVS